MLSASIRDIRGKVCGGLAGFGDPALHQNPARPAVTPFGSETARGARSTSERAGSRRPEVALFQGEDRPAQALRTHALQLQRHGVVVRDETQELDAGNAEAAHVLFGADLRVGGAVLQQADLAEEIAGVDRGEAAAIAGDQGILLEDDEEVLVEFVLREK